MVRRTSSGGKPAFTTASGKVFPYTAGDVASRAGAKAAATRSERAIRAAETRKSRKGK